MNGPDVRELNEQKLAERAFPANARADFRLYLPADVHRGIQQHAKADVGVEICGVLVGDWGRDDHGPFASVSDIIRCDSATSKFAEVTFTHESWAQINREMDGRFSDKRIVGWYHSHPDFGVFLSDRDVFIHQNFFAGAGQVAYVVDPVRDLEGVFVWKKGKPEPISHYWIGDRIRTVDAIKRPAGGERDSRGERGPALSPDDDARDPAGRASRVITLLAWLGVFVVGYGLGGMRSRWEQSMIVEGAVAHYGVQKLMKPGFEENISALRGQVRQILQEYRKLPDGSRAPAEEEAETVAKRRRLIDENLVLCDRLLEKMSQDYGLSEAERNVLARLVALKEAELHAPPKRQNAAPSKPGMEAGSSTPASGGSTTPGSGASSSTPGSGASSSTPAAGETRSSAGEASPGSGAAHEPAASQNIKESSGSS